MPTTDLTVPTADGDCPAVLAVPEGDGPWPGVLLFMDAGGVRPQLVALAQDVADLGYAVLLPELYHRVGAYEPFDMDTAFSDPDERARLMGLARSLTVEGTTADTAACLAVLAEHPQVAGSAVGTTGYCMGGAVSLRAAAAFPDRVAAAASVHGGRLATEGPGSPHLVVGTIAGRVYVAGATDDDSFTAEQQAVLEAALTEAGVDHRIETYDAAHGFAVQGLPTYDAAAEARHRAALADLFGATLGS